MLKTMLQRMRCNKNQEAAQVQVQKQVSSQTLATKKSKRGEKPKMNKSVRVDIGNEGLMIL